MATRALTRPLSHTPAQELSETRRRAGGGDPFDPASISGLRLWLDAADASTITQVANSVSQWSDKSGRNNHATQGLGAKQPITNTRTVGGKNVLDFSSGMTHALALNHADMLGLASSANTIIIVGVNDQTGSIFDAFIGGEESGGGNRLHIGVATTFYEFFSHSRSSTNARSLAYDNTPHIQALKRTGATGTITGIIDGVVTGVDAVTSGGTMAKVALGAVNEATGEFDLDGAIGEVLIYNRALTDAELNQVGNYLKNKWSVAWTNLS